MPTDDFLAYLTNKKLLPYALLKDEFFDYLRGLSVATYQSVYREDGVFDTEATVTGTAIGEVSVPGAFDGTDGEGKKFEFGASDSRLQDVPFENSDTVPYNMGLRSIDLVEEIEINPRTGQPEYSKQQENIGTMGTPDAVVDNGSNITLTVDSVTESGVSHAGRTVRVYLLNPKATNWVDAHEDITVSWTGSNNKITTTGLLGQQVGDVSITPADYVVVELGPVLVRTATQNLQTASGILFLADFLGNTGSAPTPDMTGQRVIAACFGDLDNLWSLSSYIFGGMVLEGAEYLGESPSTYAQLSASKIWVQGQGSAVQRLVLHPITSVGPLPASSVVYIYHDGSDHTFKYGNKATAYTLGNLPILEVTTDGSSNITATKDLSFRSADVSKQGVVTVGQGGDDGLNTNFVDLQAAVDWIGQAQDQAQENWPGVELWVVGDFDIGSSAVTIPATCKGLTIRGTNWLGKGGRGKIYYGDSNTDIALFKVLADGIRFLGLHFNHQLTGTGTNSRIIENVGTPQNLHFEGCVFDSDNDNLAYAIYGGSGGCNNFVFKNCDIYVDGSSPTSLAAFYQAGLNWHLEKVYIKGNSSKTQLVGGGYGADYGGVICCSDCNFDSLESVGIDSTQPGIEVVRMVNCLGGLGEVRNGSFHGCIFNNNTTLEVGSNDSISMYGGLLWGINPIQQSQNRNITLVGVNVKALAASTYIINSSNGSFHAINCVFDSVNALGGSTYAISLNGNSFLVDCKVISKETSSTGTWDMIRLVGNKNKLLGCVFDASNWRNAILCTGGGENVVKGCNITNPTDQSGQTNGAIYIFDTSNYNVIEGNILRALGDTTYGGRGIALWSSYNQVIGNTIEDVEGYGIYLQAANGHRNVIDSNNLKDCGLSGSNENSIQIDGDYNTIVGNVITNSVTDAIELNGDYNELAANVAGDGVDDNGTGNNLGVFGTQLNEGSVDTESTTTSTTPVQKLRVTGTNLPAGRYRIGWSYEWHQTNIAGDFLGRLQIDDTTTVMEHISEPHDTGTDQWYPTGGIAYVDLTAATHNFDIDYWTSAGGTARIRRTRLEVWRVS